MHGEFFIFLEVDLVKQEEDKIETGKQSLWQVDVLIRSLFVIVATEDGVSGGQNRGSRIQTRRDAGLGD